MSVGWLRKKSLGTIAARARPGIVAEPAAAPITAPRAAPRRAKPKKAQAMTFASSWFGRRRLMPREPATKRSHGMAPARPQAQAPLVARTAAPPNTFNPVVVPKEQSKSSHREEWNQESKGKMRKGRRRGGITVMIG
jgi:hypothetical protein